MSTTASRLLTVGLISLVLFMVARFPAATAFAWFAPAEVQAFGVTGTVWSGEAKLINAGGLQLRNTEWNVKILRLLTGRLSGPFRTRWGGGFIEADGGVNLTGTISLENVKGSFDIAPLNNVLGIPNIGGIATVDLSEVIIRDNWPQRLVGRGELRSLSSPLMGRGDAQFIGDVGFLFNTDTETALNTVTGQLQDTGGPLQLNGTLILTPPGNYDLKTRLKARASAPETLQQNLKFLGSPEADGTHLFQLAGSI